MNNTPKRAEEMTKKFMRLKAFYEEQEDCILFDYITAELLQEMYCETEDMYGYTIEDLFDDVMSIVNKQIKVFKAQSEGDNFEDFLRTKLQTYPRLYEFILKFCDIPNL